MVVEEPDNIVILEGTLKGSDVDAMLEVTSEELETVVEVSETADMVCVITLPVFPFQA